MTSRQAKRLLAHLLVAIALVAASCAQLRAPAEAPPPRLTGTATAVALLVPVPVLEHRDDGWYLAQPERYPLVPVDRVIDGDTLDIRVAGATVRVRLFGVDAAEQRDACYSEATLRLITLAGREVRLATDARTQDDFGRELRYAFTPAGRSIDALLIDEGLGSAWRDDGALRSLLVSIEEAARGARRGCVWAPS